MRKLAPAFILASIVALSSGTAFAFGDMNKTKKTSAADTASTQTAPSIDHDAPDCAGQARGFPGWRGLERSRQVTAATIHGRPSWPAGFFCAGGNLVVCQTME